MAQKNSEREFQLTDQELLEQYQREQQEATKIMKFDKSPVFSAEETPDEEDHDLSSGSDLFAEEPEDIYSSSHPENETENSQKKQRWYQRLFRFFFPVQGDSKGVIVQKLVCLAMTVVCVVSAAYILNYAKNAIHTQRTNQELANLQSQEPTQSALDNLPTGYTPESAAFYEINSDYKGWIQIDGTRVNLPVVQTDNNDYYLSHDFYKKSIPSGVPFIDYRCTVEPGQPLSTNTIIYGHNMKTGDQFADLLKYKDWDFYKDHATFTFDTAYQKAQWKIIGVFLTTAVPDDGSDFYYFNFINAESDEDFYWFIREVKKRSYYDIPIDVQPTDRLLTLSTCDELLFTDGRFVVVARQVREGEDPTVDVSQVYVRETSEILWPQIYYDNYVNVQRPVEEPTIPVVGPDPSEPEDPSDVPVDSSEEPEESSQDTEESQEPSVPDNSQTDPSDTDSSESQAPEESSESSLPSDGESESESSTEASQPEESSASESSVDESSVDENLELWEELYGDELPDWMQGPESSEPSAESVPTETSTEDDLALWDELFGDNLPDWMQGTESSQSLEQE